jgi:hypothetical protein
MKVFVSFIKKYKIILELSKSNYNKYGYSIYQIYPRKTVRLVEINKRFLFKFMTGLENQTFSEMALKFY